MEQKLRKSFQGIGNIIRFNWHFYLIAFLMIIGLQLISKYINVDFQVSITVLCIIILGIISLSLLVSFYVYDISDLYTLKWVNKKEREDVIVNISAGFDETSHLLKDKFPSSKFIALDFYDPKKHTEVSIKRARKAYPPSKQTVKIETDYIPLNTGEVDVLFVILSAHEIRNKTEQVQFFKELYRVSAPKSKIYVTEHLRDLPNFLAYTIGFFHFYSKKSWSGVFLKANFKLIKEVKITPFISTFILQKNGTTP